MISPFAEFWRHSFRLACALLRAALPKIDAIDFDGFAMFRQPG